MKKRFDSARKPERLPPEIHKKFLAAWVRIVAREAEKNPVRSGLRSGPCKKGSIIQPSTSLPITIGPRTPCLP
jgi:hypothetical protein